LEKQYEVRAKISGTITKIEIKSINDFVEVVAYVRPDVVDNGVGGDHSLSSTQPFREVPSATCPAPLTSCDVASVVSVVDGDTLDLLVGGRQERVRLIGVDTPETVHPSRPVECYGPEASSFTKQLQGKQVWLTYGEDCYDKYGRLLAYLWLNMDEDPSLEMFNKELISLGYARAYTRFPFQYLNEFVGAEAGARAQERGLWGVCE
jgi:micrococcal nuclease